MHNKRMITLLILLAVMATSPPPLKLFDNQLKAQSDAYFYDSSPDDRDGNAGFNFDDFSSPQGYGFIFGGFSGSEGNGFNFDDFNGNGGNGFSFDDFANNDGDGFSFGNFNHTPDNVPLDSGLLLLTGFALLWRKKDN